MYLNVDVQLVLLLIKFVSKRKIYLSISAINIKDMLLRNAKKLFFHFLPSFLFKLNKCIRDK
jgi:hypothetical protein